MNRLQDDLRWWSYFLSILPVIYWYSFYFRCTKFYLGQYGLLQTLNDYYFLSEWMRFLYNQWKVALSYEIREEVPWFSFRESCIIQYHQFSFEIAFSNVNSPQWESNSHVTSMSYSVDVVVVALSSIPSWISMQRSLIILVFSSNPLIPSNLLSGML